jgi:outer membrane usher protein
MERAWSSRLHKLLAVGLWFLGLLTIAAHPHELAKGDRLPGADGGESILTGAAAGQLPEEDVILQLEAFINGVSTGLIGSFRLNGDGSLSVAPDELRELGLIPAPRALAPDGMVDLTGLPHVAYDYDEAAQAIRFITGDGQRVARKIGLEREDIGDVEIERGFGALMNYTLSANFDSEEYWHLPDYSGLFGYFDTRLFTSWGTLDGSFSARSSPDDGEYVTRLDTAWTYSDPETMRSYAAGDFISSGLAWTRPIRMGGVQVRRNFGLRPDLVTIPVPELAGSAAVPSAVDIYLNGIRTYSNDIPSGPFVIDGLPAITGPGIARVVVRDTTTGQETETEVAFYASTLLLKPGLADYALEAGFARRDYGITSDSYDGDPIASASLRYGLTDHLTLEAHGEVGAGLVNGGGGFALGLGGWGVGSLAGAVSEFDGDTGFLVAASLDMALFDDLRLYMRSQRSFGEYQDLASVTANIDDDHLLFFSTRPPEALDQISLAIPLAFDASSLNLSFTHIEDDEDESEVVSLSYDRPLFSQSTFFASAYADLDDSDEIGAYAGISVRFGGHVTGTTGVEYNARHANAFVDVMKPDSDEEGSYGWRLRVAAGDTVNTRASAAYVARHARIEAGAQQYGDAVNAAAQVSGAVVAADGDLFLSRQIYDSFAIVDVGAPGVEVIAANRTAGLSGRSGKLVVPRLTAYEKNRIAVDPKNLPVDADIPETSRIVVPADKTGVVVSFNARANGKSALVQFVDAGDRLLEAGLAGRIDAGNAEFIVGYDGEAYITRLGSANSVTIDLADGTQCHAQFDFREVPGEQQLISGVPCR